MDQFTFPADPAARLRMHNQGYQEEIRRAAWRQARAAERRSRADRLAAQGPREELAPPPKERSAWLPWRDALRALHLAGGAR
jgi:hypothetical protein